MLTIRTPIQADSIQLEGTLHFRKGASAQETGVFLVNEQGEHEVLATTLEARIPLGEVERAPSGLYAKITGHREGRYISATAIQTCAAPADPYTPTFGSNLVQLYDAATQMCAAPADPYTPTFGNTLVQLYDAICETALEFGEPSLLPA